MTETPQQDATTHPTGAPVRALPDGVWAELEEIAARYPQKRSGLLPMLHLVQSYEGMVTPAGIEACAQILELSAADVSGVATFYTMYKRRPVGDYHVGVCTNTLCAVMGGDLIFDRLKDHLDIGNDETTPEEDGRRSITLEHIECNAACDYAPVMTVNWEFMDDMTPQKATDLVDELRSGAEVRSTRGPAICTWREAERVLAGYPDGRVDEGPAGGLQSLVGLSLAAERGWTAPDPDASGTPDGVADGVDDGVADGAPAEAPTERDEAEEVVADSEAQASHEDVPEDKTDAGAKPGEGDA